VNVLDRIAAAPISWGVCEVPGWGAQMAAQRVLAEMGERLGAYLRAKLIVVVIIGEEEGIPA
jgi:hypothetical protein